MSGPAPIRLALLSLSDKSGAAAFAKALAAMGVALISSGGTASMLRDDGISVRLVEDVTGFPEMMDGRIKTLHPHIHGGLLARRGAHEAALAEHGIEAIGLLAVNLYPFEDAVSRGASFDGCIETIDVGGPALLRGAAKNHDRVTVICDAADYARVIAAMKANGGDTTLALRRELAAKAFAHTAAYDAAIASWFAQSASGAELPEKLTLSGVMASRLRYGENPHQKAAFYRSGFGGERPGAATARIVQGKALSYNNINDADAAYELAAEFDPGAAPAIIIVKHANPCGAAIGATLAEAYRKALACDPLSAFGGVIALNRPLDAETAAEIGQMFTEVIIAPDASEDAIAALAPKKNLRLLLAGRLPDPRAAGLTLRSVAGGILAQSRDNLVIEDIELRIVTERAPSEQELADMIFAFKIAKHVKSNAIVYAKDGATAGIGAGQMSRVDAARIAALKAQDAAKAAGWEAPRTIGSAVASDAFFPFADGLIAAADAGATAIIQPGGSLRDDEVIAAANARGLAMAFTGARHFRH